MGHSRGLMVDWEQLVQIDKRNGAEHGNPVEKGGANPILSLALIGFGKPMFIGGRSTITRQKEKVIKVQVETLC